MANDKEGSDPYVYRGTSVLRNLAGIRDDVLLQAFETDFSVFRQAQLAAYPLPGNFDLLHLQAIHRYLFQDVYDWAGKLRTVDIAKGGSRFGSHFYVEDYARKLFGKLAEERTNWKHGDIVGEVPARLAHYLGEINALHPFREGNGRVQRTFIGQLAQMHGLKIRWQGISQAEMVRASAASFHGDPAPLVSLIRAHTRKLF